MRARTLVVAVALLGSFPPPIRINAATIRALRAPDGGAPCEDGLSAAIRWIGQRDLSLDDAEREARSKPSVQAYVEWGMAAIGDGDGYGYGYGDGYGDGSGSGDGSGDGYGDGDGGDQNDWLKADRKSVV